MRSETARQAGIEETSLQRAARFLGSLIDRRRPSPEVVLIGTALVVGILTGLGAIVFRYLISAVLWLGYEAVPSALPWIGRGYVVLVPAIGGLLVGLLVTRFAREAKGHGVPEVMEAVALRGGRIRPQVAAVKALASAICIGSGGSAGREGPIVQIGSSIGSTIGQALDLSDERVRNLVACGAASGIAATFNAPIAGVMFALEVILGEFSVRYLSTVVVAAVAASVIGKAAFGDVAAFPIPNEYGVQHVAEYGFYVTLGVLAAGVGILFVRSLYATESLFERWGGVPEWAKPGVGGLLLGLLALLYPVATVASWERMPQVFNVGYEVIEAVLESQASFSLVAVLLVTKIVATSLTLGSGGSGGVFAPSLFIGAMLGAAFAHVLAWIAPGIPAPPGAYALVGMAAVFAAAAHAPITAFLIVFELTGDYGLILPLMLTVVIATLLGQRGLGGESIYTLKLSRRGVRLRAGRDTDVLRSVTVAEVMATDPRVIPDTTTVTELAEIVAGERRLGFVVLDDHDRLWGIVTASDLDRAIEAGAPMDAAVTGFGTPRERLLVAYPEETMGDALARMAPRGVGRLPVVSRDDPRRLVGLLRRSDIARAYDLAIRRRDTLEIQGEGSRIPAAGGMAYLDMELAEDDAAVGRSLAELGAASSVDFVVVSIRREGRVVMPKGATRLQARDRLGVYAREDERQALHALLARGGQG